MDRRDALLLVERLKRRTRDSDVLTLSSYATSWPATSIFMPAASTSWTGSIPAAPPGRRSLPVAFDKNAIVEQTAIAACRSV
jgi:hypothetical protein